jgi:hypothetical protein
MVLFAGFLVRISLLRSLPYLQRGRPRARFDQFGRACILGRHVRFRRPQRSGGACTKAAPLSQLPQALCRLLHRCPGGFALICRLRLRRTVPEVSAVDNATLRQSLAQSSICQFTTRATREMLSATRSPT